MSVRGCVVWGGPNAHDRLIVMYKIIYVEQ